MKFMQILVAICCVAFFNPAATQTNSCLDCHAKMKGRLGTPVEQWHTSVHNDVGITCVDCHGGNAEAAEMRAAHSRAGGWIGKPSALQTVQVCGTCHADTAFMKQYNPNARTDQLDLYRTSSHGENILKKKDGRAATCASCHGAHDVLRASNPQSHVYATNVVKTCATCHADEALMGEFGISGTQVDDYKKSVHNQALTDKNDLFAPTCNDCHGNHGAVPPGVTSIVHVCGTCHVQNEQLFNESPHMAWEDMGFSMCAECHNHHEVLHPTEAMLSPEEGICLNCHVEEEDAFQTMVSMHDAITGLKSGLDEARERVDHAAEQGMPMDEALLTLQEGHNSYIKSRTAVHKFNADHVNEVVEAGMTSLNKVREMADNAITEVMKRRTGLYLFIGFIVFLVVLLWLKVRSMEQKSE